jgi:hypothetical protein
MLKKSYERSGRVLIALLLASALFATAPARADEATKASPTLVNFTGAGGETSTHDLTDDRAPGILDKLYVNYFGIFHGESINNISSPYTVDRKGALSTYSGVNFDSEITAAYMFTDNIGAGPDIPFLLVPVLGQGVILGDLGVKAFDTKTVSYRGLNLYTNLILQGATSKSSQAHNETLGVKMTPYVRYSFPRSRFSVGAWSEEKAYLGVTSDKTFKLYAAPYVNYRLTSTLSLNLEYEAEAHHNLGDTGMMNFTMYQTDIEPGLVWMITPKVMFNPYLQVFTTGTVSSDNMALGAVISATVL